MAKVYLGIDPGAKGALAAIFADGSYTVMDAPAFRVTRGLGKSHLVLSEDGMAEMITGLIIGNAPKAAIEWAQPMPKQGVTSVFNYGTGFGLWLGVLAGLSVPRTKIRPQAWMKVIMSGADHDKSISIATAKSLFPNADISLKKHDGRAEALLIAEWLKRTQP